MVHSRRYYEGDAKAAPCRVSERAHINDLGYQGDLLISKTPQEKDVSIDFAMTVSCLMHFLWTLLLFYLLCICVTILTSSMYTANLIHNSYLNAVQY